VTPPPATWPSSPIRSTRPRRVDWTVPLEERGVPIAPVDVTDDASMVGFVEKVSAKTGRIDVLVNNAGYGSYRALEDVPIAKARRHFDVNMFGLAARSVTAP
jgi:NAD(P)-dependent dehydrogenase (short-subunit alcohol dehydrogenase family)